MIKRIVTSKFLLSGMVIGLLSVNLAKMFYKPLGIPVATNSSTPSFWTYILPPIAFFALYKAIKFKPNKTK